MPPPQGLGVEAVVLAGYMKLVPAALVRAFPRAMLNIHPALLPAFGGRGFYGAKVHAAVVASGARVSGPTVHFVDEQYDTGAVRVCVCVGGCVWVWLCWLGCEAPSRSCSIVR